MWVSARKAISVAAMVLLLVTGCSQTSGGGAGAAQRSSSSASTSKAPTQGSASSSSASAAASFPGWTVSKDPSVDATLGLPAPSWQLPGDVSSIWRDDHTAYQQYSFIMMSQGLADFFFGCNSTGQGTMFRIDTRANNNWSGFAATTTWTSWGAPSSGFFAPAGTWIHVVIGIQGSTVTAHATWMGGAQTVTLKNYKPLGTAYGFNGDGLGGGSLTWVSNFQTTKA